MRHLWIALPLLGTLAFAQPKRQFEVASIRQVEANNQQVSMGLHLDGQQARISSFNLRDYVGMAFNARPIQINGPDWMTGIRFDINATLPAGATTKDIDEMMETLLIDRFGLKFHREKKDFEVYVLERGKKPLALKPVAADAVPPKSDSVTIGGTGSAQGVAVNLGGGASYTFSNGKFEGKKLDVATMVDTLSMYMNLPVINQTNLDGFYDVAFEITQDDYRAMLIRAGSASGIQLPPALQQMAQTATTPSLFDAIEALGLKLESRKVPLDVIVVEQINKQPTEN